MPKKTHRKLTAKVRSLAAPGSFLAVASELLTEATGWYHEYNKRSKHYYDRRSFREAAHYEDLACAAHGNACDIRRLIELSGLRQPKKNDEAQAPHRERRAATKGTLE